MRTGTKVALLLAVGASAFIAFGAEQSSAACRQVFTNTTCSGVWPFNQRCTNHFKTVCETTPAPASSLIKQNTMPQINNAARPATTSVTGGRLISQDGAGLISQDGAGMRRK